MTGVALRRVEDPRVADVGDDAVAMLEWLGGASAIRVRGRDSSRCRVVVSLLHGNELSGIEAIHGWLVEHDPPVVDALFLVASVDAALREPRFSHRILPGTRDLNRCFLPPFDDLSGALARAILSEIDAAQPEYVVDIHNNSGDNPPYVIGTEVEPWRLGLAGVFARRYIHSELRLGSLMEAVTAVPCVTFECGRIGDPRAAAAARGGIDRFLGAERIEPVARDAGELEVYESLVRVRARDGLRLAVSDAPQASAELTITRDIDRHNFERVGSETVLGWVTRPGTWPIEARDSEGRDRSAELFSIDLDGTMRARGSWIPIMMTTDPVMARQDCLFYIVQHEQTAP